MIIGAFRKSDIGNFNRKGVGMNKEIRIGRHVITKDSPTFIVAEMSANHNMDFGRAVAILQAAKDAGADAVKIQTYTADTITLDSDAPCPNIVPVIGLSELVHINNQPEIGQLVF